MAPYPQRRGLDHLIHEAASGASSNARPVDETEAYACRAGPIDQSDNRALRAAYELQTPLVYFRAFAPSQYLVIAPMFVTNDDPAARAVVLEPGGRSATPFWVDPPHVQADLTDLPAQAGFRLVPLMAAPPRRAPLLTPWPMATGTARSDGPAGRAGRPTR
jgi:hypothetical protein